MEGFYLQTEILLEIQLLVPENKSELIKKKTKSLSIKVFHEAQKRSTVLGQNKLEVLMQWVRMRKKNSKPLLLIYMDKLISATKDELAGSWIGQG